jgi:hypothetical protein
MVDNQHKQIQGYRDLSQQEIDLMNMIKSHEAVTAALVASVKALHGDNPQSARDIALARTSFEDAHIRLVRAVARPVTPWG